MKKTKELIKNLSKKGLMGLERTAEKKATEECFGFLYEPKIPKKLKKTVTMALVGMFTVVSVLAGSIGVYKADSYSYRTWSILRTNPTDCDYRTVQLYDTIEQYQWTVTDHALTSGYGYVELSGTNNKVVMVSGENKLSEEGTKYFRRKSPVTTEANPYVGFKIKLKSDGYVSSFRGYISIRRGVY